MRCVGVSMRRSRSAVVLVPWPFAAVRAREGSIDHEHAAARFLALG
jgi:hypothetical protein